MGRIKREKKGKTKGNTIIDVSKKKIYAQSKRKKRRMRKMED